MYRGHHLFFKDGNYFYSDTGEPTIGNHRGCGICKRDDTVEGHDGCLGYLSGVMNACCGHGSQQDAYIQYWDGRIVHGSEVIDELRRKE